MNADSLANSLAGTGLVLAIAAVVPAALLRIKIFFAENGVQTVRRPYPDRDPVSRRQHDAQMDEVNERNTRYTRRIMLALFALAAAGVLLLLVGTALGGQV